MEVLQSTSRAELGRQRKEAEEAATLLGSVWSARLKSHYVEPVSYTHLTLPTKA